MARNPKTPPTWLKGKKVAQSKWRELYEELRQKGLLSVVDRDLLAMYCDAWQQLHDLDKELEENGRFFKSVTSDYIQISPRMTQRNKVWQEIRALAGQLGIGVTNRKGIDSNGGSDTPNEDDLGEYAKKKAGS